MMKKSIIIVLLLMFAAPNMASSFMTNVYGRKTISLNGRWNVIIDLYEQGERMEVYKNLLPKKNTDFYEYSFDGGMKLNVPGDWNCQNPELKYYEGTIWYARHFTAKKESGIRKYLYFCGVSNRCNIYLNGVKIKSHEGAFTPFEVEVTKQLKDSDNFLVVEANNQRQKDALPALSFDWWNYGGITRDVFLVSVPQHYIRNYSIQLDKYKSNIIHSNIQLSDNLSSNINIYIPELHRKVMLHTDNHGFAKTDIKTNRIERWSPRKPKLYRVILSTDMDKVEEDIGFRNINVQGTKVLLNGKRIFLRSISFHEEIPQRMGRAYSQQDADYLLGEAKALGVNMLRLAHYQQNEYIVRQAERMGIILWQEVPVWQDIDFTNAQTLDKAKTMLSEIIQRDRNRCAECFWGIANETKPSKARNTFLLKLLHSAKAQDTTRLFVAAFDDVYYNKKDDKLEMHDDFIKNLDVIGVNKYMGWYASWPKDPSKLQWDVAESKPLFISEFGGEALFGREGNDSIASNWSEDYQARLYKDNLKMFANIPNLIGISPWALFDFRSPFRFNSYQNEWNRKGLISNEGKKKKAWYIIHDFYKCENNYDAAYNNKKK